MKIRQLYTFKIVCEEESITRAAERLSTTQPAISRTISELEETLGTQLFDRTSRKIVLNEAGQLFLSKVIPLLELYEDLEKGLPDSDVRYQLRIGATPSLAGTLLFQILEKFRSGHEDVQIRVTVDSEPVLEQMLLQRQIDYNTAISEEGLKNPWGAQVGRTLLESIEHPTLRAQARAAAAAGSDARMNGCALPVVINSGSGNQGITCTMPVVTYAKALGATQEQLYRALTLTNLIALHQKRYIGNLSAYCGAVSAGTAAACGIAYLEGADYEVIGRTIVNAIGNAGGIVCDGAKASCAAKIATAVEAGIMGYEMARRGRVFPFGEGLVETDYEQTIRNIGYMGRVGMQQTDVTILNLMLDKIDA